MSPKRFTVGILKEEEEEEEEDMIAVVSIASYLADNGEHTLKNPDLPL